MMKAYYAEKIYVLVHRCHEQCLWLMRSRGSNKRLLHEDGISTRQGIILKMLLMQNGLTQKELTERLEITSSSCGELITKLEQSGYLEKRISPGDKRTFNVYLTRSGRSLAVRYQEKCEVEMEEWAAGLSHQEKEQLYHLLGKLSEGLENQMKKAAGKTAE